jgi:glucokinase
MSKSVDLAIGIDLGGTKIAAGLVDSRGRIRAHRRASTPRGGPRIVIAEIASLVEGLLSAAGVRRRSAAGVGVGIPGQLDLARGIVLNAPNLEWKNVAFASRLAKQVRMRVAIDNDVRCAALGEWRHGAGRGCDSLVCIFVGTGIGGGVIIDGRLIEGATGTAGEVGHTYVRYGGPRDSRGDRGCLEALASGTGIAARAARELKRRRRGVLGRIVSPRAEDVVAAARKGDRLARKILHETADDLAAGVASVINLINPERVILGGGVIDGTPELARAVARRAPQLALPAAVDGVDIVRARLRGEAGVVGAAALVFERPDGGNAGK